MMDPNVCDVTVLRRLLCWANESQQYEEQRVREHMTPQYHVLYHTPSVDDCEALFRLEDTR